MTRALKTHGIAAALIGLGLGGFFAVASAQSAGNGELAVFDSGGAITGSGVVVLNGKLPVSSLTEPILLQDGVAFEGNVRAFLGNTSTLLMTSSGQVRVNRTGATALQLHRIGNTNNYITFSISNCLSAPCAFAPDGVITGHSQGDTAISGIRNNEDLRESSIAAGQYGPDAFGVGVSPLSTGGNRWFEVRGEGANDGPGVMIRQRPLIFDRRGSYLMHDNRTAARRSFDNIKQEASGQNAGVVRFEVSTDPSVTDYPVGTVLTVYSASLHDRNSIAVVRFRDGNRVEFQVGGSEPALAGTWRARGKTGLNEYLFQRVR